MAVRERTLASMQPGEDSSLSGSLRAHWPEYLIEAWALGMFMVSAGVFAVILDAPGSPVNQAVGDPDLRRALGAIAMGLTAIAIIYSPWGQRSGAHMNPAVTLAFLHLGKVKLPDALFYVAAQFAGGTLGVLLVWLVFGDSFAEPPVQFAATVPGEHGVAAAMLAEFLISLGMMAMILAVGGSARLQRFTGLFAGFLVAAYITFESPLSGMSMNPARTFASAAPAGMFGWMWLYVAAPVLGMLSAAFLHERLFSRAPVPCAKYDHAPGQRCIHCGYEP
ncbi:MAG TPA: aquaporin [Steroidobacteraceae bacterium]|nr:aquaporin [Steroidobacteraceae bacterium]